MLSRILHLKYFFKDPDKKHPLKIIKELITYGWIKKEIPTDYFRKFLYRTEILDYKNYLSLNQFNSIITSSKMVFPEISAILNDKLSFSYYFESYNMPIPKLISYNLKDRFYFNGHVHVIKNKIDLIAFFENIFDTTGEKKLFLKLINGISGKGALLLSKKHLNGQIETHGDFLLSNSLVHQKLLEQHPEVSKIHAESINSIRIETYIDSNKQTHILSALMRFGVGKSIVDNTGSGGFSIALDLNSGRLRGVGRQDIVKGGRVFTKHPDTNIELNGYKIPFIAEACELAKKATTLLPNRIVGWDIAICKDGPMIIEGNHNTSLHITDIAYGGYCKHPLIREILKEIKSKN